MKSPEKIIAKSTNLGGKMDKQTVNESKHENEKLRNSLVGKIVLWVIPIILGIIIILVI